PTGRYLGLVHIQEMLRHPPHEPVGIMLDTESEPLSPDTALAEVSKLLAAYNLVSVPITDENDRLVGVVTVDDVLDELLPEDWRTTGRDDRRKRSEEHTSELQSRFDLVCRLLLETKQINHTWTDIASPRQVSGKIDSTRAQPHPPH